MPLAARRDLQKIEILSPEEKYSINQQPTRETNEMSSQMTISPSAATTGSAKAAAGSAKAGSASTSVRRVNLAHNQSLLQVTASAVFGIRFRRELMLSQKIYPAEDEYELEPEYNANDVSDDFMLPAKSGKTRHAPNGRQKQRQAKNVELTIEIKKAVKRNAKIDQSQLPENSAEQDQASQKQAEQAQEQKKHTARPSKRDQRRNTQYRTAKHDLKAQGGMPPCPL